MRVEHELPWEQYALLTELAVRMHGRGRLGKTAVQKLVYFLQELHGVDVGYDFPLYTYGPYSSDLMYDLDVCDGMGGVAIQYQPAINGYDIKPGPIADKVRREAGEFLRDNAAAIDAVVSEFGSCSARDLELRATIVFAEREGRRRGQPLTRATLVERVAEIKPHFSRAEISGALDSLARRGHITPAS